MPTRKKRTRPAPSRERDRELWLLFARSVVPKGPPAGSSEEEVEMLADAAVDLAVDYADQMLQEYEWRFLKGPLPERRTEPEADDDYEDGDDNDSEEAEDD